MVGHLTRGVVGGALGTATKELVALAIAVAQGCGHCIELHARAAASHGAAEGEVAEALGVAILMSGGPGTRGPGHVPAGLVPLRRPETASG